VLIGRHAAGRGVGSVLGTLAGLALFAVIQNLIVQGFNLNSYVQQVVSGFPADRRGAAGTVVPSLASSG
jgi:ribose/xylose/arabinose/galactoside ABC-type transport system permease subunit